MHARLSRYEEMEWDQLQSSLEWFQGEELPKLEAMPGYDSIFFGVNREDGTAAAVTLWESASALTESEPVEEQMRTEAAKRAGVGRGRVVDRYEVGVQLEGGAEPAYARLARWSGLNSRWLSEGLEVFKKERAPSLMELPGFAGTFVALNTTRGRVFALFLWDSLESLRGSEAWERESSTQLESATGPRRRSIFEVYQVAIAPKLAQQAS